jgi:hypothetical protein
MGEDGGLTCGSLGRQVSTLSCEDQKTRRSEGQKIRRQKGGDRGVPETEKAPTVFDCGAFVMSPLARRALWGETRSATFLVACEIRNFGCYVEGGDCCRCC